MTFDHRGTPRSEERKQYLIYIVLDTSKSMRMVPGTDRPARNREELRLTQMGRFSTIIPQLLYDLSQIPTVAPRSSFCVVAFNDVPEELLPPTSLQDALTIKAPSLGTATDYAKVLCELADKHPERATATLRRKQRELGPGTEVEVARPWIFFITDGRPTVGDQYQSDREWQAERERLTGPPIGARIAAIGLPGADERVLWELSTGDKRERNAFIAKPDLDPALLATSVGELISRSVKASLRLGQLVIQEPPDMRRIDRRPT
jgi:uncharacterized protein YegL